MYLGFPVTISELAGGCRWLQVVILLDWISCCQNVISDAIFLFLSLLQVLRSLSKAYTIGEKSIEDLYMLMKPLCNIRSLLSVHGSKHEEEILKNSLAYDHQHFTGVMLSWMRCWVILHHFALLRSEIMDNKIFFQHPDLMRLFCVHETTMQLMVATLNKSQQEWVTPNTCQMLALFCFIIYHWSFIVRHTLFGS